MSCIERSQDEREYYPRKMDNIEEEIGCRWLSWFQSLMRSGCSVFPAFKTHDISLYLCNKWYFRLKLV